MSPELNPFRIESSTNPSDKITFAIPTANIPSHPGLTGTHWSALAAVAENLGST